MSDDTDADDDVVMVPPIAEQTESNTEKMSTTDMDKEHDDNDTIPTDGETPKHKRGCYKQLPKRMKTNEDDSQGKADEKSIGEENNMNNVKKRGRPGRKKKSETKDCDNKVSNNVEECFTNDTMLTSVATIDANMCSKFLIFFSESNFTKETKKRTKTEL